jgi:integrase
MLKKSPQKPIQNASRKNLKVLPASSRVGKAGAELVTLPVNLSGSLAWWIEQYFKFEVTTAASSQTVQRRDLVLFLSYVKDETGGDQIAAWTPRLSRSFQDRLRKEIDLKDGEGKRRLSDRTINRVMAHLKTFSKWVHKLKPFALGDPMAKVSLLKVGNGLEIERACSAAERRKILDAADLLLRIGGESKDRNRNKGGERPKRKGYRAYRNRAVIYCLLETGMRRAAVVNLDLEDVDFKKKAVSVREKGGLVHRYQISNEGLQAIRDYVDNERKADVNAWDSPALFLPASTVSQSSGRLSVNVVNQIWNEVAEIAGVEGKTPHSARHAMGRHIIEKTGNIAAVQRQLGHKNAAYSMQYARISERELGEVIEDR